MPLFTSVRDTGLLKGLNKEITQRIISMEVALFKISIEESEVNIYGESDQKVFYDPIRVYAIINPDDKNGNSEMDMISYERSISFGFIKQELEEKEVTVEEGDFIFYDNKYFEVDQVSNSNYWSGRNPNNALGTTEDNWSLYGYDYAIRAEAHLTNAPDFITRKSQDLLDG